MEKIEKNGKVAILHMPFYGTTGWSAQAECKDLKQVLCMDARIVGHFVAGEKTKAIAAALAIFPELDTSDAKYLEVKWVDKGEMFYLECLGGGDLVRVIERRDFYVA